MKHHISGHFTTVYFVEDLDGAKRFYSDILGQEPYLDEPYYVGFNIAGAELGLRSVSSSVHKQKGCIVYWNVRDIEEAVANLEKKGRNMFQPIWNVGGGIKVATFLDMEGNIVGLIENPHIVRQ